MPFVADAPASKTGGHFVPDKVVGRFVPDEKPTSVEQVTEAPPKSFQEAGVLDRLKMAASYLSDPNRGGAATLRNLEDIKAKTGASLERASTPFKEIPQITVRPEYLAQMPALKATEEIWNKGIKPLGEFIESPVGLLTFGAGAGMEAVAKTGVPLISPISKSLAAALKLYFSQGMAQQGGELAGQVVYDDSSTASKVGKAVVALADLGMVVGLGKSGATDIVEIRPARVPPIMTPEGKASIGNIVEGRRANNFNAINDIMPTAGVETPVDAIFKAPERQRQFEQARYEESAAGISDAIKNRQLAGPQNIILERTPAENQITSLDIRDMRAQRERARLGGQIEQGKPALPIEPETPAMTGQAQRMFERDTGEQVPESTIRKGLAIAERLRGKTPEQQYRGLKQEIALREGTLTPMEQRGATDLLDSIETQIDQAKAVEDQAKAQADIAKAQQAEAKAAQAVNQIAEPAKPSKSQQIIADSNKGIPMINEAAEIGGSTSPKALQDQINAKLTKTPVGAAQDIAPVDIGPRNPEVSIGNGIATAAEKRMLAEQKRLVDEHLAGQKRIFYRGTDPGNTQRINEPFDAAKGKTFAARTSKGASQYGSSVEEIIAKPEAKILSDDTPEFWRVIGRKRPPNSYIGSAGRKGESLVDVVNDAIRKADKAGYDAISIGDADIGTVILNEKAFTRAQPKAEPNAPTARQGAGAETVKDSASKLADFNVSDWLSGEEFPGIPNRADTYRPGSIAWGKDPKRGHAIQRARSAKQHAANVKQFNEEILPKIVDDLTNKQLFEIAQATDSKLALDRSGYRLWRKGDKQSWLPSGDPKELQAAEMGATVVEGAKIGAKPGDVKSASIVSTAPAADLPALAKQLGIKTEGMTGERLRSRIEINATPERIVEAVKPMKSERGSINPHLVAPLAGGASGAAYGATQGDTPEERLANAMLYGSMGLAAGLGISAASLSRGLFQKPFRKYTSPGLEKYVKMLEPKVESKSMIELVKDKYGDFRFRFNTKWAPIGDAQRSLFKATGRKFIPSRYYDLERTFERIAGAPMRGELKVGKLLEVVESLPKAEVQDLDVYLTMSRVEDRLRTQVDANRRLDDAVSLAQAGLNTAVVANRKAPGVRNTSAVLKARETLKKAKSDLKTNYDRKRVSDITLEQAQKDIQAFQNEIGPERYGRLVEAGEKYQDVMRTILNEQVTSGRMKPELVKRIQESSDFYAPFKVLKYYADGEGFIKGGGTRRIPSSEQLAKKITGIDDADVRLESPLATSAEMLYKSSILAEKNVAMRKLATLAKLDPDGVYLRPVGKDAIARTGYEIVNYFQNGEVKRLEVNKQMGEALSGLNSAETGMILDGLGSFSRVFKLGATGLSVPFNIANAFVFDPVRLATISRYGFRTPKDLIYTMYEWPRAMGAAVQGNFGQALGYKPGDLYSRYMESGAAGGTLARVLSPESFKSQLPKNWKLTDRAEQGVGLLSTPLKVASLLTSSLEDTTKLLGLSRALRIEKFDQLSRAEQLRKMPEIANEIRNYSGSPDFARSGIYMKPLNIIMPFMNPRWQGFINDAARVNPFRQGNLKDASAAWMRLGTLVAVPSAALYYYNNKDPVNRKDFNEIPKQERDRYYHFPQYEDADGGFTLLNTGKPYYFTNKDGQRIRGYYRIPKRELPALVANTIEDMGEFAMGEGEQSLDEFGKNFAENTVAWSSPLNLEGDDIKERVKSAASGLNPAMRVPAEIALNENLWSKRKIVPEGMVEASGPKQFDEKTPEIYKDAANALPEFMGDTLRSPMNLQYAAEAFTGGFPRQFTRKKLSEGNPANDSPAVLDRFFRSEFVDNKGLMDLAKEAEKGRADERLDDQRMAEQIATIMLEKPTEAERQKIYMDAGRAGLITEEVNKYLKENIQDAQRGLTYEDRVVKRSFPVVGGWRAKYYIKKLSEMGSNEAAAYMMDQQRKALLSDKVLSQMEALKNRK